MAAHSRQFRVGDKVTFNVNGMYSTFDQMSKIMGYPEATAGSGSTRLDKLEDTAKYKSDKKEKAVVIAVHHEIVDHRVMQMTKNSEIICVLEFKDKFRLLVNGGYLELVEAGRNQIGVTSNKQ